MMANDPIVESMTTFKSHGTPIRVERFEPEAPGRSPAVLILHGSGGMHVGGPAFRMIAGELARRGYVAHLVHYLDRTGTTFAADRVNRADFTAWMETIGDAVTQAAGQPNADPTRIGLIGFSLGAYLALSLALHDPRIAAVVDVFGGLPDELAEQAGRLPPTLILHGQADRIVPVGEARKLERLLKANAVPHEIHIYPAAGHGFFGPESLDSARRMFAFFDRYLLRQ